MARITVEDCLEHVDNRFNLVMVAAKRARQIAVYGKEPMVEVESDKPTVVALREIAEGLVTQQLLEEAELVLEEPELILEEPSPVPAAEETPVIIRPEPKEE